MYEVAVWTKVLQMFYSIFQSDFRVVQQVYGRQRASKVASHQTDCSITVNTLSGFSNFKKPLSNGMQTICLHLLVGDTPFYISDSFKSGLFGVTSKCVAI